MRPSTIECPVCNSIHIPGKMLVMVREHVHTPMCACGYEFSEKAVVRV